MVVSLESYDIHYQLFLAEQELYDNIIAIAQCHLNESVGLISLNESIKETVSKYITKVTTALENAWNKFKEIINRDNGFLSKIKEKIFKSKPDFKIENYQELNAEVLNNVSIVPFNYEQMKDDLNTQEEFIKKHYNNLMKLPDKSLKENISYLPMVRRVPSQDCTPELLAKMFNFCFKDMPQKSSKIKSDLNIISVSYKEIDTLSSATSIEDSVAFYRYYIKEDSPSSTQLPVAKSSDNTEVSTTPQFKDGENHGKNNATFVTRVTNYVKVSVDVITGKMIALRNIFSYYMKIIKHYISPKSVENKENNGEKVVTTQTKTTINT